MGMAAVCKKKKFALLRLFSFIDLKITTQNQLIHYVRAKSALGSNKSLKMTAECSVNKSMTMTSIVSPLTLVLDFIFQNDSKL